MKHLLARQETILDLIRSCDNALSKEPGDIDVLQMRGLLYSVAEEYDKALTDLEQIIKALPGDVLAYYLKSDCYYNKGEFDLAKRDYMRALRNERQTTLSDEDIDQAVVQDNEDLQAIKAIIEHEKEQAFKRFLASFGST